MLRTLLVLPYLVIAALVVFGVMIPVTWLTNNIAPMYAVTQAALRFAFKLAGIEVVLEGLDPHLAPRPCIFVCNHVSNIDPPALFAYLPRVAIIAKAVLFRWPLWGFAMRMGGFIPVERGQADSRARAFEAAMSRLREGLSLLVFPEGTRSRDGQMLPFRAGPFTMAIQTQSPIVPITIVGARQILRRGKLGISPGRVRLIFHQPVATQGINLDARQDLIARVRATVASGLENEEPSSNGAVREL